MSDDIYISAVKELEELRAKCREIEIFLAHYDRYRSNITDPAPNRVTISDSLATWLNSGPQRDVLSAVHDILEAEGDAVPLSEIYERLQKRAVAVGGQRPRHNLAQKLHANGAFKSFGKRGWYFSDRVPRSLLSEQNEKDPDDVVAGSSPPVGSEGVFSRPTSVPSGRDQSGIALVPSAPQPKDKERGTNGLVGHR
jgi:hypothetical protein